MVQKHLPASEMGVDAVRGFFVNTIRNYREHFSYDYGEMIICRDARRSWRRDYFPYYKSARGKGREDSKQWVNWDVVFEAIDVLADEFDRQWPYKVITVDGAEADDIIAAICLHTYWNEETYIRDGIFSRPERQLILSSDSDFKQLQIMDHVDQYSYRTGKTIRENRPDEFLQRKILTGDRKDGVPNILSDDDCLAVGKRQSPMRETKIQQLLEVIDQPESKLWTDDLVRNYHRNQRILDLLRCIPEDKYNQIIEAYDNAYQAPRSQLLNYFMEHKLKQQVDSLQIF